MLSVNESVKKACGGIGIECPFPMSGCRPGGSTTVFSIHNYNFIGKSSWDAIFNTYCTEFHKPTPFLIALFLNVLPPSNTPSFSPPNVLAGSPSPQASLTAYSPHLSLGIANPGARETIGEKAFIMIFSKRDRVRSIGVLEVVGFM